MDRAAPSSLPNGDADIGSPAPRSTLNVIVATDCGSTTTKAILIERQGDVYRQTFRGEAPTTVEAPFEDVTRGVLNALAELEELSGRQVLDGDRIVTPADGRRGVDLYVSTSSAGGGLQMMVAGVVSSMSAQSAQRAALGAGAIVMDVIASNDGRLPHERIERIRRLRPDMILLSGGTDGGTVSHVVELAELIRTANPHPRLASTFRLPVIYAGNRDARGDVEHALAGTMALHVIENLRPALEREHLGPARREIQKLFLEHVMAQAPGYPQLMAWTGAPIMPTPAAVGEIMQTISREENLNVVGVDIGGATTDVFSVYDDPDEPGSVRSFHRTVSANLGMSYSVSNVLAEAGLENVLRWIPFSIDETDLRDRIRNKMIRPTTIPQTLEELWLEHALAREALRLAFAQHRELAVGLRGVRQERDIAEAFQQAGAESLVDLARLDLLVGSGGVLSHAPRRSQAMLMMLDAFQPEWMTRLAVDSIFMMPHLGVLATVDAKAATDVFHRDCLIDLGSVIAPVGTSKPGAACASYRVELPDGRIAEGSVAVGEMRRISLGPDETAKVHVAPARHFDVGAGRGRAVTAQVGGGVVGLVIDARGRPLVFPDDSERIHRLQKWAAELQAYPR